MTPDTIEPDAKAEGSYGRFEILVKSTEINPVDYVWIIERNKKLPPICVELEPGEKLTRKVLIKEDDKNLKYCREIGSDDIDKVVETTNNLLDKMHDYCFYPHRSYLKLLQIKSIPL